jgi:uncharacterized Zn finger protein
MSELPGEQVRGFPALPARKGNVVRPQSWWGRAWIEAMEESALDADQLRRGRRHATSGQVGPITVSPGRIAAPVHDGTDDLAYHTAVSVDVLTETEWDRFRAELEARSGHVAALLDGEMPRDLVSMAAAAGVALLPGIGDLEPECDCPGWELPCTHAAALSYQVSWLLDADPFVLLLMRGRGRDEVLEMLRRSDRGSADGADVLDSVQRWLVDTAAARARQILAAHPVMDSQGTGTTN